MKLFEFLNRIDRRYAWSFLGFLLAVLFGGITLYTEFVRDRRPDLRFEILSSTSVLDLREQLGDLEIVYDGIDIQRSRESLRVIVARVVNDGPEHILNAHYDPRVPLGFRVTAGNLVRAEVIGTSSEYLAETLKVHRRGTDVAFFDPVILEAGEWFTLKSLVLHPAGALPQLEPLGKVAGVHAIRVVDVAETFGKPGFAARAFAGDVWVQLARLGGYFAAFIVLLIAVVLPSVFVTDAIGTRRRRRRVARFRSATSLTLNSRDEYIFSSYVKGDIGFLRTLRRAATDEARLNKAVARDEESFSGPEHADREVVIGDEVVVMTAGGGTRLHEVRGLGFPIRSMKRAGFIEKVGDRWVVNADLRRTLEEFLNFLEEADTKGGLTIRSS